MSLPLGYRLLLGRCHRGAFHGGAGVGATIIGYLSGYTRSGWSRRLPVLHELQ